MGAIGSWLLVAASVLVAAGLFWLGWRLLRSRQPSADKAAQAVFIATALVGVALLIGDPGATLAELNERAREDRLTVTKTTTDADGNVITETTVTDIEPSITSLVLSGGVLLIVRFGLVALAAFLAAAAVQRAMLGRFELKVGVLEIPAVTLERLIRATARVPKKPLGEPDQSGRLIALPEYLSITDLRLRLIAFRVELEAALRHAAERLGMEGQRPASALVEAIRKAGAIDDEAAAGYLQLIRLGNELADGAQIDEEHAQDVEDWMSEQGLQTIYWLKAYPFASVEISVEAPTEVPAGQDSTLAIVVRNTGLTEFRSLQLFASGTSEPVLEDPVALIRPTQERRYGLSVTVPPGADGSQHLEIKVRAEDRAGDIAVARTGVTLSVGSAKESPVRLPEEAERAMTEVAAPEAPQDVGLSQPSETGTILYREVAAIDGKPIRVLVDSEGRTQVHWGTGWDEMADAVRNADGAALLATAVLGDHGFLEVPVNADRVPLVSPVAVVKGRNIAMFGRSPSGKS